MAAHAGAEGIVFYQLDEDAWIVESPWWWQHGVVQQDRYYDIPCPIFDG
jgi:hypothetical protein